MKTKGFILLISVIVSSCVIGKRGVEYTEMAKKPTVQILQDNLIAVNTDNSFKNSALLIYKIDYSVDTNKKVINLNGFQALNKKYKDRFEIKIKGLNKIQLDNYDYFWIDPDNKMTKIEKIK
jgi:hypothetical protein